MAEEDASGSPTGERVAGDREGIASERMADDEETTGIGFSLPPILLPEVEFPERIRLAFPVPEPPEKVSRSVRVEASWVLLAVILVDVLDALAVVLVGPTAFPWARAVVGVGVAVVLVGGPGLLYSWELLAIFGGFGTLSVAPTLTALMLASLLLSQ